MDSRKGAKPQRKNVSEIFASWRLERVKRVGARHFFLVPAGGRAVTSVPSVVQIFLGFGRGPSCDLPPSVAELLPALRAERATRRTSLANKNPRPEDMALNGP